MILDEQHKAAFDGYAKPLAKLEEAFKKAGYPKMTFRLFVDAFGNKMVSATPNRAAQKVICIEGDSPAQAVKDVAKGVWP